MTSLSSSTVIFKPMLDYFGTEFLDELVAYYQPRYTMAVERGYDKESSRYNWLFLELRDRLLVICQMRQFLKALPSFMAASDEEHIFRYVVSYATAFFKEEFVASIARSDEDAHPFFNDNNPYWRQMNEVLNSFGSTYDTSNLPLLYIDLCEYSIRCLRLYLQLRESCTHPIDRGKFDAVMKLAGTLSSTA